MKFEPLKRDTLIRVIEGKGAAERVPMFIHFWTHPENFHADKKPQIEQILSEYPQDAQVIPLNIPSIYDAPAEDPSYRWSYKDQEQEKTSFDNAGFIDDWDEELDALIADFPSADYPGLIRDNPPSDGRYRLGMWWYFYFERFWSMRGMENTLCDFYENPEAVHAVFRKLCDFYKRMIERAHDELHLDGIFTSDDLGTQTSTFFSTEIFDEFFAPYYKEVIDKCHELGMHFWLHACGNIEAFIPKFIELGIDVLHPIQKYTMDEQKIAKAFGGKITVWAGFDVQQIIPYGTPEDVRREVTYLIDTYARPDGRFMFTLGNGATPDTPVESLRALMETAFGYSAEKLKQLRTE